MAHNHSDVHQPATESGTFFVYFEATTVILTLVLLGQLLEAMFSRCYVGKKPSSRG